MMKKIITICLVPCVLFMFVSLFGCGKEDDQTSPESTTVKSFKFDKVEKKSAIRSEVEKESPESNVASEPDKSAGTPDAVDENQPEKALSEPGKVTDKKTGLQKEKPEETVSGKQDNQVPDLPPALSLPDDNESTMSVVYNPEGQIDPFEPLFKGKQERDSDVSSVGRAETIRGLRSKGGKLTPLEKMDISQLKLTAIILGAQKNIAMVQESTGKGHVIKKGTYIGINSGRVIEITRNTVIIEEEVEDLLGKIIVRKRELKLQKPLGEM